MGSAANRNDSDTDPFRLPGVNVTPRPARPFREPLPVTADMARLEVSLRPETPDDIPLIRAVYAESRAAEMLMLGDSWTASAKRDFVQKQFAYQYLHHSTHYGDGDYGIVLVQGRPAGRFNLYWGNGDCRLFEFQLLAAFRNRGIGSTLIGALLGHARARKHSVSLHVERMSPARRLYARFGFVPTGVEREGSMLMLWRDGPVLPAIRRVD